MADSIRRRIRDRALVTLAGLVITGPRVWPMREHRPLEPQQLPALLVDVDDGRGTYTGIGGYTQARRARLVVEALVHQTDDLADPIEEIWQQVEVALAGDRTLGGAIKQFDDWDLGPKRTEPVGQLVVIRQALQLQCLWFAPFGSPDVTL
jgi:hypothetical protein